MKNRPSRAPSPTPDHASPSTACLLQRELGLEEDTVCFDLNAACAGFLPLGHKVDDPGVGLVADHQVQIVYRDQSLPLQALGEPCI